MEHTTLGVIPAGTGNGLVKSLLFKTGEKNGILPATFAIIKGRKLNIDLIEMELEYH